MIVSSGLMFLPTSLALDAEHDLSSDEDLSGQLLLSDHVALSGHSALTDHASMEATDAATESVSAPDINDIAADLGPQKEGKATVGFGPIARGVIKPLVALITTQYVIVAAMVAGVAVTVADQASRAIHEKFAAIVSAIERF